MSADTSTMVARLLGAVRLSQQANGSEATEVLAGYGVAVPVGVNSTTGIAGLTLGGGFGWITRKYGLTVDSLVSADVDPSLERAVLDHRHRE